LLRSGVISFDNDVLTEPAFTDLEQVQLPEAAGKGAIEVIAVAPATEESPAVEVVPAPAQAASQTPFPSSDAVMDSGVASDVTADIAVVPLVNAPIPIQLGKETKTSSPPAVVIDLTRQHMSLKMAGGVLYYKSAYYGTLNLGTPSVPYTFVFDTGSGHLILPSSYCHSATCKAHKRYKRSGSSTARDIEYDGTLVKPSEPRDQISVSFGTGEVTGVFVEDVVCMGEGAMMIPDPPAGASTTPEVKKDDAEEESASSNSPAPLGMPADPSNGLAKGCMKMRIIAATEMSADPFKDFKFDGILGLGLDALSQTPEFNFINMVAHRDVPKVFAVFLGEHQEKSELSLGGWGQDHLEDDLFWNPVVQPELGHWLVKIKSLRVDDQVVDFCKGGCKGVVDTGTSLMAVPPAVFPDLYELMRHPAQMDGLCAGPGPTLHFELEHVTISMGPEDYATPAWWKKQPKVGLEQADNTTKPFGETRRDVYCRPLLMSMDMPEPVGPKLFILGEPVLRKYYTVYDSETKRVGFGKARHAPKPAEPEPDENDETWFDEAEAELLEEEKDPEETPA